VLNEFNSEFIFSAHDHSSFNFVSDFKKRKHTYVQGLRRNNISEMSNAQWRFGQQSPSSVNEIIVPTCSYRMGSNYIGYGVLTIGKILNLYVLYASFFYTLLKMYTAL